MILQISVQVEPGQLLVCHSILTYQDNSFIARAILWVDDTESQWKNKSKFGTTWGWGSIDGNWY